jgi:hypothetical protein
MMVVTQRLPTRRYSLLLDTSQKNLKIGNYTHQLLTEHQHNLPSWVEHLSYGGLIKPTNSWLLKVKKMNKYFRKYHGPELKKKYAVAKQLSNFIHAKENISLDLVQSFIKL